MTRYTPGDVIGHNSLLVIVTCSLLLFMGLGSHEVQSWDESLFAMRSRAMIEHDAWWDQTTYAAGGLYSSTYPPLSMWGMAFFMKPMKMSPFSVRLFSVLCAVASLFLIHGIALLLFSKKTAMLAPAWLTGTLIWNHYARQGMTDVPLVTFSLLALYALMRLYRETDSKRIYLWALLFAVATGAALMTKIVVSLLPIAFVAYALIRKRVLVSGRELSQADQELMRFASDSESRVSWKLLSAAIGLAILIAAPWHIMMISTYGMSFLQAFGVPHLHAVVENNSSSLGPFYYINQIIVAQPLSLFALSWFIAFVRDRRDLMHHAHDFALEVVLALWLLLVLVVFSLAPTKNPHYTLLIVPPAILLGLRGLESTANSFARTRLGIVMLALVLSATVWSASQALRDHVQSLLVGTIHNDALFFVIGFVLVMLLSMMPSKTRRMSAFIPLYQFFRVVVPIVLVFRVGVYNKFPIEHEAEGAKKVGRWLHDAQVNDMMYLSHAFNSSDTLAPQLMWYTDGWAGFSQSNPWHAEKHFRHAELPMSSSDSTLIASLDTVNVPIVLLCPKDDSLRVREVRAISRYHRVRLETPSYVIFSRRSYSNTEVGEESESEL